MKRPSWLHRIEYLGLRVGLLVLSLLPERLAYRVMGWASEAFLLFVRSRMRIGLANVRLAFGPELDERTARRFVRRGTANAFQNVLDLVYGMRYQRAGRLAERIDLTAVRELGAEPPFIGCTGHLGSWEMSGLGMGLAFGESHSIARMPKNPLIAGVLMRYRESAGFVIHPRRGGIRPVARALHDGKVALQVVDQNQRLRGVFVPFFGRLASTERAAATLAVRKGYPVLIGAAMRVENRFRFRFDVVPSMRAEATDDLERDVASMATRINAGLEALVRRWPEQYLWIHDRYRTRPAGADAGDPTDS